MANNLHCFVDKSLFVNVKLQSKCIEDYSPCLQLRITLTTLNGDHCVDRFIRKVCQCALIHT